jgi:hypothetical protein
MAGASWFSSTTYCYHRCNENDIESLMNSKFIPGKRGGTLYGAALYSVYDIKYQGSDWMSIYGNGIIKYQTSVNKETTLIFIPKIARMVWGNNLVKVGEEYSDLIINSTGFGGFAASKWNSGTLPAWHLLAQLFLIFKRPPTLSKEMLDLIVQWTLEIDEMDKTERPVQSADIAQKFVNTPVVQNWIKKANANSGPLDSIIYFGSHDGGCLITFNTNVIVPVAWTIASPAEVRSNKFFWRKAQAQGKMIKQIQLTILARDFGNQLKSSINLTPGMEDEALENLDSTPKLHALVLASLLDTNSKTQKLSRKRLIKYLKYKIIKPSIVYNKDPLIFHLLDLNDPELLKVYEEVGGKIPKRNAQGMTVAEYIIENGYTYALPWLFRQPDFDPMVLTSKSEPLYVPLIKKDLGEYAVKLMKHPEFDFSPEYLPIIKVNGKNKYFSSIKEYLAFVFLPHDDDTNSAPKEISMKELAKKVPIEVLKLLPKDDDKEQKVIYDRFAAVQQQRAIRDVTAAQAAYKKISKANRMALEIGGVISNSNDFNDEDEIDTNKE